MGGRAEAVGSTLELVHLGCGQLGEQVRRNADAQSQIQVLIRNLDPLVLAQKRLQGGRPSPPSNQNLGLQGINPKPVLGTKVAENIKERLQQAGAVGKEGHIISIQEDANRNNREVGALQPGQARPVRTQVRTDTVDK